MEDELDLSIIRTILTENDSKNILNNINRKIDYKNKQSSEFMDFPGSHPVTLLKKHIDVLINEDYYVCEKSDGIRVLLYIHIFKNKTHAFFIDRKCKVYAIDLDVHSIKNTLFDGELYIDTYDDRKEMVYSIFDTLIYNDESVTEKNLQERLSYAYKYVYYNDMRNKAMSKNVVNTDKNEDNNDVDKKNNNEYGNSTINDNKQNVDGTCNVSLIVKNMSKCYGFCEVYKNIPNLKHKNDGMIFTPVKLPYIPGRCDKLYKWKPTHLNSIDFLLERIDDYVYVMMCFGKNNNLKIFDYFYDVEGDSPNRLHKKVVEMNYSENATFIDPFNFAEIKGGWLIYKVRTDKETPNSHKVVVNVMYSLKESLEYEDLEIYFHEIRNAWKEREEEKKRSKL